MGVDHGMARAIWWAAMLTGLSYMLPVMFDWHGPAITAWKGACVGLLAAWAAVRAQSLDGRLITAVMALGAIGDVVLNTHGLKAGAIFFVAAHVVAILLYLRNRRAALAGSQALLGWLLVPGTLIAAWGLTHHHPDWPMAVTYAGIVGLMAALAWTSRFPRYRTGIGAILFVLSDLAILAGQGEYLPPELRRVSVWPLYFGGQALIVWGVVSALRVDPPR
jgi:uncharacterized membrane protein YhhN